MIVKLTQWEYSMLIGSAYGGDCDACKKLLDIYDKNNKSFDTETLSRQQLIHIETTCRKNGELVK